MQAITNNTEIIFRKQKHTISTIPVLCNVYIDLTQSVFVNINTKLCYWHSEKNKGNESILILDFCLKKSQWKTLEPVKVQGKDLLTQIKLQQSITLTRTDSRIGSDHTGRAGHLLLQFLPSTLNPLGFCDCHLHESAPANKQHVRQTNATFNFFVYRYC